jgi:hypothetical protein
MRPLIKWILLTALVAGTLDLTAAIMLAKVSAGRVCQYIASGVFGPTRAFTGGTNMVVAGIIFHYIIALGWTALFFFLYPRINSISKNKFVNGVAYGIFVWLMMNLVIVPLSNVPGVEMKLAGVIRGMLVLIFAIGIPISMMAHNYYSNKERRTAHA